MGQKVLSHCLYLVGVGIMRGRWYQRKHAVSAALSCWPLKLNGWERWGRRTGRGEEHDRRLVTYGVAFFPSQGVTSIVEDVALNALSLATDCRHAREGLKGTVLLLYYCCAPDHSIP